MASTQGTLVESIDVASASVIRTRRFVKQSTTDFMGEECDAGEEAIGVSRDASVAGSADTIDIDVAGVGVSKVECGGNVTAGDELESDAEGRAVSAAGAGSRNGIAREDGVSGRIIEFWFRPVARNAA